MTSTVGVVGAGTMGAGIAQVAAVAGHPVLIVDAVPGAAARAVDTIRDKVKAQVAKGRISVDPDTLDLTAVDSVGAALASNTSSLSPTALAVGLAHPERLVGLHFFNPVPAMKLVEVIS